MIVHLLKNAEGIHPDLVEGIEALRAQYDCLWMDVHGVRQFDPQLQLLDPQVSARHQPLRLIHIALTEIDFCWKVFADQWKRNTVVLAFDEDIQKNQHLVYELERRGIALLSTGSEMGPPILAVLKSLKGLRLKALLVEGSAISIRRFVQLGVGEEIIPSA